VRAVTIQSGELVLEERETPEPGPYDVLVEVDAAGINAADLHQRAGFYPAPPGWPEDIPGMELAGVVLAVGDRVVDLLLGRRVCALVGGGAQATHCVVPAEHLLFVPGHVDVAEAGGFPEAFITAYDALATQAGLRAGERVLISGAPGGVGVAAVQIARVLGAEVIAVTRTTEHHDRLRALGASETITLDQVPTIGGVDVVLELVGAADLTLAFSVLNPYARVVVIGVGAGSRVEVDLLQLMQRRTIITGSTMRSRSAAQKSDVVRLVGDTLVPRWRQGEFVVPIAKVFALEEAAAAYDFFAQPGKFGKVVLRVDHPDR
jgi:NADPH:quinone reductase-like Zn-dependent oxidoreductase